jgi:hypothetical protein
MRSKLPAFALLAFAVVATACGGSQPDAPATTQPATSAPEPTTAEATTAAPTTAEPTTAPTGPVTFTVGEAHIETTGDVAKTFTIPVDAESTFDPEDNEHDLLFLGENGNALRVSVQVEEGDDDAPFIAVGMPGTSLFDEKYFPDQWNSQCEVELAMATPTQIEGSFTCDVLERGDGKQVIDVTGTFQATV